MSGCSHNCGYLGVDLVFQPFAPVSRQQGPSNYQTYQQISTFCQIIYQSCTNFQGADKRFLPPPLTNKTIRNLGDPYVPFWPDPFVLEPWHQEYCNFPKSKLRICSETWNSCPQCTLPPQWISRHESCPDASSPEVGVAVWCKKTPLHDGSVEQIEMWKGRVHSTCRFNFGLFRDWSWRSWIEIIWENWRCGTLKIYKNMVLW